MARSFASGSSQYLENTSFSFVADRPYSLACWWKPADTTTQSEYFSVCDASEQTPFFALGSRSDGADFRARFRVQIDYVWGSILSAGTWYHVGGVNIDDTNTSIYTDGSKVSDSVTARDESVFDTVAIGALRDSTPSNHSNGDVAEAAIWNTNLTDGEMLVLAAGYSPLFVRPQNLIFYAPLIRTEDFDRIQGLALTTGSAPTVGTHPPIIYPALPQAFFKAAAAGVAALEINMSPDANYIQIV